MSLPEPLPSLVLVGYKVEFYTVGRSIRVEADLQYRDPLNDRLAPSLSSYVGSHPSVVYVDPPNQLMRLLGDTHSKRLARAVASVSRWGERTVRDTQDTERHRAALSELWHEVP